MTSKRPVAFAALIAAATLTAGAAWQTAQACTRIFANDKGSFIVVARGMDWATTTEPIITVLPRGLRHDGGKVGPKEAISENPLQWKSDYGSVVTTIYGIGSADGINERGLATHMLYFPPADYGVRQPSKPGLQAALWAQYALDKAATVSQAFANLEKIQVVKIEIQAHGQTQRATVHLALEDASGDSAILEYIGGKLVVYHGRQYRVMTNAPAYDEQLRLLSQLNYSNPTMDTRVPGNVNPRDRFQRATYFLSVLSTPKTQRQAIAGMFTLIRNASIPFGAPVNGSTFNTEYRTVSDLTDKSYYFELTTAPNVIWVDLKKLDFD
ncbi:MAG TPA: linear amide C-N hydrolase, partial [Candidatus Acidoferrum sp.]|nr:linear amide C-N hydrolase [Candidatus Acidoferrum sp.]